MSRGAGKPPSYRLELWCCEGTDRGRLNALLSECLADAAPSQPKLKWERHGKAHPASQPGTPPAASSTAASEEDRRRVRAMLCKLTPTTLPRLTPQLAAAASSPGCTQLLCELMHTSVLASRGAFAPLHADLAQRIDATNSGFRERLGHLCWESFGAREDVVQHEEEEHERKKARANVTLLAELALRNLVTEARLVEAVEALVSRCHVLPVQALSVELLCELLTRLTQWRCTSRGAQTVVTSLDRLRELQAELPPRSDSCCKICATPNHHVQLVFHLHSQSLLYRQAALICMHLRTPALLLLLLRPGVHGRALC